MSVDNFLFAFSAPGELATVVCTHHRERYRMLYDTSRQSIRDVGAEMRSLRDRPVGYRRRTSSSEPKDQPGHTDRLR